MPKYQVIVRFTQEDVFVTEVDSKAKAEQEGWGHIEDMAFGDICGSPSVTVKEIV